MIGPFTIDSNGRYVSQLQPQVVAPSEPRTLLTTARDVYGVVALIAAPVAMAVSYKRNKSLGWALLTGLFAVPYLVYVGISPQPRGTR